MKLYGSWEKLYLGRFQSKSFQPVAEVVAIAQDRLDNIGIRVSQWNKK